MLQFVFSIVTFGDVECLILFIVALKMLGGQYPINILLIRTSIKPINYLTALQYSYKIYESRFIQIKVLQLA